MPFVFEFFEQTVGPFHPSTKLSRRFCTKANFFPETLIIWNEKYKAPNRLCHGVNAQGEWILQFIHPSKPVMDTYPNIPKGHKVLGLILIGQEMKVIRRGTELVRGFMFWHKNIPNKVLYAAKVHFHVTVEGTPEYFFPIEN